MGLISSVEGIWRAFFISMGSIWTCFRY